MPKFKVALTWEMYGTLIIEANSIEEAERLAVSHEAPLPDRKQYIDGSIEVSEGMDTEQVSDEDYPEADYPEQWAED